MSKFNARVAQVKIANYSTPPQNLPQFQNPFLLLSDTEALNQILKDKGGSPNVPAVRETPYIPPVDMPSGLNPTNPRNPTGLIPTNPSNPTGLTPVDQPAGLVPTAQPESQPSAPISGGAGRSHPSEPMPNRFANLDDDAAHRGHGVAETALPFAGLGRHKGESVVGLAHGRVPRHARRALHRQVDVQEPARRDLERPEHLLRSRVHLEVDALFHAGRHGDRQRARQRHQQRQQEQKHFLPKFIQRCDVPPTKTVFTSQMT